MSNAFKFNKHERDQILNLAGMLLDRKTGGTHMIDRIEQIISERGDGWVSVEDRLPMHGQLTLTYTPDSDITEQEYRLIRYGTQLSGFPIGVTHYKIPSPPKPDQQ